jgi:8-oxo-dGTP pyrophosphatase MutT (NUDIX family)
MLRRNTALGAFGGMWVFPGGRIDEGDRDRNHPEDEVMAARRAAVREAKEEAGLVIAEDALVTFAHWIPPGSWNRRFSTWFFLAPTPDGTVTIDMGEIHDHEWTRPVEVLRRRDEGDVELAPPTWVTLARLSCFANIADALRDAASRPPDLFATRLGHVGDTNVALWADDAGYETADAAAFGARHRLWMETDGWWYEEIEERRQPGEPPYPWRSRRAPNGG